MRSLERKIGAVCRAVAVKVAEGHRATNTTGDALNPECPTQQGGRRIASVCVSVTVERKRGSSHT